MAYVKYRQQSTPKDRVAVRNRIAKNIDTDEPILDNQTNNTLRILVTTAMTKGKISITLQ